MDNSYFYYDEDSNEFTPFEPVETLWSNYYYTPQTDLYYYDVQTNTYNEEPIPSPYRSYYTFDEDTETYNDYEPE
jgi:hypothetical protein